MRTCNYCGRKLKQYYEACPGCGSTSFTEDDPYPGITVIETPPVGGYCVNKEFFEDKRKMGIICLIMGIVSSIAIILFTAPFMTAQAIETPFIVVYGMDETPGLFRWSFFLIGMLVPIVLLVIGINYLRTSRKELNKIKYLSKKGILVKNIPYVLVRTGHLVNNRQVYALSIKYKDPKDGKDVTLRSNPKYDGRLFDKDGTADLLYDPEDFSNNYIDIEIY